MSNKHPRGYGRVGLIRLGSNTRDDKGQEARGRREGAQPLVGGGAAAAAAGAGSGATASAAGSDNHNEAEDGFRVYKRRWFGLAQLVLLNIIVSWDWLTFAPVAGDAAAYFSATKSVVNWLSTAFLFAFAAALPAVIYALHRGVRLSIVTASALLLVGNWVRYAGCSSPRGGHYGVVMFGQLLCGLAQPFVLTAPSRYSDLWFTHRGRVGATALATLANPFGAALSQLIVPFWVGKPSDVSAMVLYVSIISSVSCIPSFFVPARPPTPAGPSGTTPKLRLRASAAVVLRSVEFWLIFPAFVVYIGLFNNVSTLLNQILEPYGYSDDEAGIAGAAMIVVGLVASAVVTPIIDRTKRFLPAVKLLAVVLALSYVALVWMPETRPTGGLAGPAVVLAATGAAGFSMLPIAIELLVEFTHPVSPEVSSALAWAGSQLFAGVFIIISDALRDDEPDASPPGNMRRALVFTAALAVAAVPPVLALGRFGRQANVSLKRTELDKLQRDVPSSLVGIR